MYEVLELIIIVAGFFLLGVGVGIHQGAKKQDKDYE